VKTFQVLKNITRLTNNEQGQDKTKINVGEFLVFGDVSERGWKIFFGSNKKAEPAYQFSSNLTERLWSV